MRYFFLLILILPFRSLLSQSTIQIDTSITYQTITGWEVMGWMANWDSQWQIDNLQNWNTEIAAEVANLGFDRIRIEVYSGSENTVDYFSQYLSGTITRQAWKNNWYAAINDNNSPSSINKSGYHFSRTIYDIENVALPIKNAVEGLGRTFYINLNYVDFNDTPNPFDHYTDPAEYAEFMLACFDTLQNYFGFVPDAIEVILEPDITTWNTGGSTAAGNRIANVIAATGDTLANHGYFPDFIAPSPTNAANALPYTMPIINHLVASNYLTEVSYHKYGGQSNANLMSICSLATTNNLTTSMLEWWDDNNDQYGLYKDLFYGCVSAWQSGIMAEVNVANFATNGTALFSINDSDLNNPIVEEMNKTRYFRQFIPHIPKGSIRIDAHIDNGHLVTAFKTPDDEMVINIIAEFSDTFTIENLPDATYGIRYSTQIHNYESLPDITVMNGTDLTVSMPQAGVLTVFGKDQITDTDVLLTSDCIEIYPNPSSGFYTIKGITQNYAIDILNSSGGIHQSFNTNADVVIDLSALPAGLFFIRMVNTNNNKVSFENIIKYNPQ